MSEPTGDARAPHAVPDDDADEARAGATPVCQVVWCPFCTVIGAVQPIRPEMVEHLLKAGAELLLAVRAVVDTRVDGADGEPAANGRAKLEKIDLG